MRSKQNKKKLLIAVTAGVAVSFLMLNSINSMKSDFAGKLQQQNQIIEELKNKSSQGGSAIRQLISSNKVVVVKANLKAGTRLTADMLEINEVKPEEIPKEAFNDINSVVGQILSADLKTGSIITKANVLGASFASLDIPLDMRAITIPVEYLQGLASYITVGSRVDIISTAKSKDSIKPELVIQNVKVISLEGAGDSTAKDTPVTKATAVTLQIPAKAGARLVDAMISGKLQLVTRGYHDNKIVASSYSSVSHRSYSNIGSSNLPPIKSILPPPPSDIKLPGVKNLTGLTGLPEPATPVSRAPSKKVEFIQANMKSEVTFD